MYQEILIATDGSDAAQAAVLHGLKLAGIVGAQVTIVTVTELWSGLEMAQQARKGNTHPVEDYEASANEAAAAILSAAEDQVKSLGVKCKTLHIHDKHPAQGIIDSSKSGGVDLIVMSSHGRRGLQKILLGSVAAEVLTLSKIPVLIVKH